MAHGTQDALDLLQDGETLDLGLTTIERIYDDVTFEDEVIPSFIVFDRAGAAIVDDTDSLEGLTKALRFPDIGNSETTFFDMQLTEPLFEGDIIRIRYRISSEGSQDFVRFFVDDTEVGSDSGNPGTYATIFLVLAADSQKIRVQYSKSFSFSAGDDTVFISRMEYIPNPDPDFIDDGDPIEMNKQAGELSISLLNHYSYKISVVHELDGLYDELVTIPHKAVEKPASTLWVLMTSGFYHRVRIEASDLEQYYHIRLCEVTMAYQGHLS